MPNATCGSEHGLKCDSGRPLTWAHSGLDPISALRIWGRQRRLNRSASARVRISPHLTPPARRRYGSVALLSSGAGSAFGVTPSTSRWPFG
jgi:hypothetical protein